MVRLTSEQRRKIKRLHESPIAFVGQIWGLVPQVPKPEHQGFVNEILALNGDDWEKRKHEIKAEHYGDLDTKAEVPTWNWYGFERGVHFTWQQHLIMMSIEKAQKKTNPVSISIKSGRGIGKSSSLAWIILWFLFAHPACRIPCTAPNAKQMNDVLWAEIKMWIARMPKNIQTQYIWQSQHVKMDTKPSRFARASTASKENPEALSGMHADHIMAVADEASAIDDPIFEAAKGIYSAPNPYFIMISNPTRLNGYFYKTHNNSDMGWATLSFNSEESPIVDPKLIKSYMEEGMDSDEYRVNVLGEFPRADAMDAQNFFQLVNEKDIRTVPPEGVKFRNPLLGVDPSGEGDNETAYVVRDNFTAMVVGTNKNSTAKDVAQGIITIADKYKIRPIDVVNDAFGVGSDVGKEIALAVRWDITTENVGEKSKGERDRSLFTNKKAEMYWKMKVWLEQGGQIAEHKELKQQILSIRARRTLSGKIEIMTKKEMRKQGIKSPDLADAMALTFLRPVSNVDRDKKQKRILEEQPFNRWGI